MSRGDYGRTPLHRACGKGIRDVVKYLMQDIKGSEPEWANPK